MADLDEYPTALRFRDIIQSMVSAQIEKNRPRYKYAVVKSIDRVNYKSTVRFPGETVDVTVNMGAVQPNAINQVVRVDGIASDRYIADVMGLAYVAAASPSNPAYPVTDAAFNTTTPAFFKSGIGISPSVNTNDFASGIYWGPMGGQAAQAGIYVQQSSVYGTKMYFATTDAFGTGQKTGMYIDHLGNVYLPRVGSALTAPKLVVGSTVIEPNAGTYSQLQITNGSKSGYSGFHFADEGLTLMIDGSGASGVYTDAGAWIFYFDSSGTLGAGTVPGARVSGAVGAANTLYNTSGNYATWNWSGQGGQPAWLWGGNDSVNMYVYNPSNFNVYSVQTGSPYPVIAASITIGGSANTFISSNGTMQKVSSSLRHKTNVRRMLGGKDIHQGFPHGLLQLEAKKWLFRQRLEAEKDRYEIGFIAEDVAEVFPDAIYYDEEGKIDAYSHPAIETALVELVKELFKRVEKLEGKAA
jgi:hypothetical protein